MCWSIIRLWSMHEIIRVVELPRWITCWRFCSKPQRNWISCFTSHICPYSRESSRSSLKEGIQAWLHAYTCYVEKSATWMWRGYRSLTWSDDVGHSHDLMMLVSNAMPDLSVSPLPHFSLFPSPGALAVNLCKILFLDMTVLMHRFKAMHFDTSYLRFIECCEDKNTTIRFSVIRSPHL